ncbi:MAG TPA: secondary thiamine-phosphate synthase enzyme YjbQ [Hyphomonadaceae bacterium]|jgi:secondary thiamine-phosphate synthase enzyme|nr:secondary thiamine-phosphate synthase enzyme YjbQ [Hyphomonadaceae bacterium]
MADMQDIITVATRGPGLFDITGSARSLVKRAGIAEGLLTLFVQHTSCSIVIQENADPDVRRDLQEFFDRLAPHIGKPGTEWIRHRTEGPDDMPAHLKAALLPTSLSIPVVKGELALGTWQGVYLFEHRDETQTRRVVAHLSG